MEGIDLFATETVIIAIPERSERSRGLRSRYAGKGHDVIAIAPEPRNAETTEG